MQRVSRRGSPQRHCQHPAVDALIWVNGNRLPSRLRWRASIMMRRAARALARR